MRSGITTGIFLILAALTGFFLRAEPSYVVAREPMLAAVASSSAAIATETYRVIKVIDGDTLVVDIRGTDTTLRLIGLDTPEKHRTRRNRSCREKMCTSRPMNRKERSTNTDVRSHTYIWRMERFSIST